MRIDELASMDTHGQFRSDVQLSDYEDPTLNRDLLRHYIFTIRAPSTFGAAHRSVSARDVLDQLKTAFSFRGENRIALIANYGHGKSHLALVLANFFARPAGSEEVRTVLERLQQALNNPAQWVGYREFKDSRGEFLVVRLQGDAINDLQEGFLGALEKALGEHEATRTVEIPFWYRQAQAWLQTLSGQTREKADAFLARYSTDLPSLVTALRRQGSYALVRELAKHVTGMYPDFGRDVNLEELVIWAVDEVCKPRGLGGLLILFDEFSLFLQKYMAALTVGKLQELLNGVSKRQGQSAFLAFSQQDVDTIADTYGQGQRREDVRKELERLPKDRRARLFSLMEGVLDAYLRQDDAAWTTWMQQPVVKGALAQARETLYQYFSKRYDDTLKWNVEVTEKTIVRGCFPLHPLTTAILSSHNFESGTGESPRTALEFVRRSWESARDQPAQHPNGKPSFVYATALVDYFEERISRKWYETYRTALEQSPIPLTDAHRAVLKGLLLEQSVADLDRLKLTKGDQLDLLSDLCGLDRDQLKVLLREMSDARVILYDRDRGMSSLMPAGMRSPETEKIIQNAVDEIPIDRTLMEKTSARLPTLEIEQEFGNAADWAPRQLMLTAELFNVEELRKAIRFYSIGYNAIEEGSRGLVIWLIALNEEEKLYFRQTAQSILDDALGDAGHPHPVVVVLPRQATPGLVTGAQRLRALDSLRTSEREKIGTVIYQQEKDRAQADLARLVHELIGDHQNFADYPRSLYDYALPGAYRASVHTLKVPSLRAVVSECYRQAYAYRVEFSNRPVAGKGVNHLRTAVKNIARWLLSDTAGSSINNLGRKDMQYQVANSYLTQKWGLLAAGDYAIQPPTSLALKQAWDLLEEEFRPGCEDVKVVPTLIALLNPPYGHDYNTLTLLLAAWLGFHQHDIRLSQSGRLISLEQFKELSDQSKSPQDLLNRICITAPLAISRSKPDEVLSQINGMLERLRRNEPLSMADADAALAYLEQASHHPRLPPGKQEEVEHERSRLEEALRRAEDYDLRADTWLTKLAASSFEELLRMHESLKDFPELAQVTPCQPSLAELQARWETAVEAALHSFCTRCETLKDASDYKAHERDLQRARRALGSYPTLAQRVELALDNLGKCHAELKKQEGERAIVAELQSMASSASLATLYTYRDRLAKFTNLSSETARLHNERSRQIEGRIQQYEQLARELPSAVERASSRAELRQQRDLLLRNLDQVQGTALYQPLYEAQQKIDQLGGYFARLDVLDSLPRNTPEDLATIEAQIADIEAEFAHLGPKQHKLLEDRKQQVMRVRADKTQEAQKWLTDLATRHHNSSGADIDQLLRQLETPPAFLPSEALVRLEQLKRTWQKQRDENVLDRIESLFRSIKDTETRRQCLERLRMLLDH